MLLFYCSTLPYLTFRVRASFRSTLPDRTTIVQDLKPRCLVKALARLRGYCSTTCWWIKIRPIKILRRPYGDGITSHSCNYCTVLQTHVPMHGGRGHQACGHALRALAHFIALLYGSARSGCWLVNAHTHALLWLTVCRISVLPPGECKCTNVSPYRDSMTSHTVTIGQNVIH